MKPVTAAVLTGVLLLLAGITAFDLIGTESAASPVDHAVRTVADTGSVNTVTAILLDYRALDTLGEATVILMTATIVAFVRPQSPAPMLSVRLSSVLLYGVMLLLPFIAVFGLAIMLFGHISPGGGFTGGVMLSTSAMFYAVVYSVGGVQSYVTRPATNKIIENSAMFAFIGIGLLGIGLSGSFLANAATGIPLGEPGTLLSAGTIPVLNLVSGLKVGVGLGMIVISLFVE